MYIYVYLCISMYICIYCNVYIYIGTWVLVREKGMGVRAAALSPMHTCVRFARADDAAVAITCACAWVRPPGYVANAHVMYTYICIYIDAKSGYVNGYACMFLRTRAIACGR
jgi:hypothetical protein